MPGRHHNMNSCSVKNREFLLCRPYVTQRFRLTSTCSTYHNSKVYCKIVSIIGFRRYAMKFPVYPYKNHCHLMNNIPGRAKCVRDSQNFRKPSSRLRIIPNHRSMHSVTMVIKANVCNSWSVLGYQLLVIH